MALQNPAIVILTYFMFVVSDVSARYQALMDESSAVLLGFRVRSGLSCSELVAALIVKVPRVPLDPLPPYDVLLGELVKLLPQIRVCKRIGLHLSPASPSVHTPHVTPI